MNLCYETKLRTPSERLRAGLRKVRSGRGGVELTSRDIRSFEALPRVSRLSVQSSGRRARTDGRDRHDSPCRATRLPRRRSRFRAVRNPRNSRDSREQAQQAARRRKGSTSSRYSQVAGPKLWLDATTGQADQSRWSPLQCSAQLILTWPCMTTINVQNTVYPPRFAVRGSRIRWLLLSTFRTGVAPGLCDQ